MKVQLIGNSSALADVMDSLKPSGCDYFLLAACPPQALLPENDDALVTLWRQLEAGEAVPGNVVALVDAGCVTKDDAHDFMRKHVRGIEARVAESQSAFVLNGASCLFDYMTKNWTLPRLPHIQVEEQGETIVVYDISTAIHGGLDFGAEVELILLEICLRHPGVGMVLSERGGDVAPFLVLYAGGSESFTDEKRAIDSVRELLVMPV